MSTDDPSAYELQRGHTRDYEDDVDDGIPVWSDEELDSRTKNAQAACSHRGHTQAQPGCAPQPGGPPGI